MANITGSIQDHTSNKLQPNQAITRVQFIDNEIARSVATGIIKPYGIIPAGTAGNTVPVIQRFAKGTAVAGGRRLFVIGGNGTYSTRSAVAGTSARTKIESYLTDAGDLDGVIINPMTDVAWYVSAMRSGSAPFTEDARIEIEIIHKSGIFTTLKATVETGLLTAGFVTYNGTTSGISLVFAVNDQLRVDYFTKNEGAPA